MKKILITTWGNPSGWKVVTYKYNEIERKSCSTLPLLKEIISPDYIILIGLDTLYALPELFDRNVNSYTKIKSKVEDFFKNKYYEFVNSKEELPYIIISYGVGNFNRISFTGKLRDFYSYLLYKLTKFLTNNILNKGEKDKEIEVHLDLSHGINFMPVLTYKALKEILQILAITKDITLKVYNSEPVIGRETSYKYTIHLVEESRIIPAPCNTKIKENKFLKINKQSCISNEERRNIFQKVKFLNSDQTSELSAFLSSVYNGFPLVLFTFFPSQELISSFETKIDELIKVYEDNIKVELRDTECKISRDLFFTNDFETLTKAFFTTMLLYEDSIKRKKEVLINEIEEVAQKVFKFDKKLEIKIGEEIYNLNKLSSIPSFWELYNIIYTGFHSYRNQRKDIPIDERNFMAHAGFERNGVKLKREKNHIYIKYAEEKLDTIRKLCNKFLF